jgi:pimeloyl-ACP methyl ester carboxylesterase
VLGNQSQIHVDDGGEGSPPVVFVHSLAGTTAQWAGQLDHLRTGRRALAIDLRGHGQSALPPDGDYSIPAMAGDIQAAIDRSGITKFILVGHSLGGSVAVAYAGSHPENIAGLLLADPTGDSTRMPAGEAREFLAALESDAYSGVVEGHWNRILAGGVVTTRTAVMKDLRSTPNATVVGAFKGLFEFNPLPALGSYPGPKLTVITHLNETPISLQNLVPGLPYRTVAGTSHWLQMDKPDEFNEILDAFIDALDG